MRKLCRVPAGTTTRSPWATCQVWPATSASPVPLTKVRIWSVSSWVSAPISPPGGMVMMTSWVWLPVHRTRRKSALCSATVAMVKWYLLSMGGGSLRCCSATVRGRGVKDDVAPHEVSLQPEREPDPPEGSKPRAYARWNQDRPPDLEVDRQQPGCQHSPGPRCTSLTTNLPLLGMVGRGSPPVEVPVEASAICRPRPVAAAEH